MRRPIDWLSCGPGRLRHGSSAFVRTPLPFPTTRRCGGKGYEWFGVDDASEEPAPRLVATAAVLDRRDVQVAVALAPSPGSPRRPST
uniref:hypothetical protein n=1 Tax=Herbidospora sakaeratensis TaxID=564415 RepID=UPI000784CF93|nr:hypothetical protein [Herbidospora sakaeratensis]